MRVFLDFEASSLSDDSYPIEVAWVFEDGRDRSFLLRPLPAWTDWNDGAERIHGISRARLDAEGTEVATVAHEMVEALSGHALFASAPSWDGKWLSVLLRGAGLPRHALRLSKSDDAFVEAARDIAGDRTTDADLTALVADIIAKTTPPTPAHRALADARLELERLTAVVAAARAL